MDIDRLSIQEQEEHRRKGLCFLCHQQGHRIRECPTKNKTQTPRLNPSRPSTNYNNPQRYQKAMDVHACIRTMYQDLPKEEQELLLSQMEEEGF